MRSRRRLEAALRHPGGLLPDQFAQDEAGCEDHEVGPVDLREILLLLHRLDPVEKRPGQLCVVDLEAQAIGRGDEPRVAAERHAEPAQTAQPVPEIRHQRQFVLEAQVHEHLSPVERFITPGQTIQFR